MKINTIVLLLICLKFAVSKNNRTGKINMYNPTK